MTLSTKIFATLAFVAIALFGFRAIGGSSEAVGPGGCCCGPECPCEVCDCDGESCTNCECVACDCPNCDCESCATGTCCGKTGCCDKTAASSDA